MKRSFIYSAVILLMAWTAQAQPQAPITWGTARLLMNAPSDLNIWNGVFAHGDTLILAGYRSYGTRELASACVSGDNGQTWSPWHTFLSIDSAGSLTTFAVTSGGLMCAGPVYNYERGIYRSTDLGQTWISPIIRIPYLEIKCARGDTLWCSSWSWNGDSVRWTADGGLHYSSAIGVDLNFEGIDDIAISDSAIFLLSRTDFPEYPHLTTWILVAPRPMGPFTSRMRLNPSFVETFSADAEFDPNGTGMILSALCYSNPWGGGGGAEFLTITRDNGQTWSEPDTFQALESTGRPFVRHAGNEWIAMWWDTCVAAPFQYFGLRYRYSANQGRSWYPMQQAFGENIGSGRIGPIELTADRVRMYGNANRWNGIEGRYYFQWEGQIHRDTLAPVITTAVIMPPILPADTTITFSAAAMDDDSLWQMEVVLRRVGQNDSIIVPLIRNTSNEYSAAWTVPNDTGIWTYYYHAEDMWENVSYYPSDGPASPWTFHISPLSSAHDLILHPSTFILSVYPNPCNSSVILSGTLLPYDQPITLFVYDLLGREVAQLTIPYSGSNVFHLPWNLGTPRDIRFQPERIFSFPGLLRP